MTLPLLHPVSEFTLHASLSDISTAASTFVAVPRRGVIKRFQSTIGAAITVADASWSLKINGTAVAGSTVTVTQSGSAAGDVDSGVPTTLSTARVAEGDNIEFVNAAGSTTTSPVVFSVVIEGD